MFPLGNVVLPGELLPLNVFEPRYRQLVLDCLAADAPSSASCSSKRGSEVGGGDVRTSIGTVARIVRVMPLGNGRFEVVAAGLRTHQRAGVARRRPVSRGDVEDWPEADPPRTARSGRLLERLLGRIDERAPRRQAVAQQQRVPSERHRRRGTAQ